MRNTIVEILKIITILCGVLVYIISQMGTYLLLSNFVILAFVALRGSFQTQTIC